MKKFKLLSMSFILSILAIAGLNSKSYAAEYEISGGYFTDTNVISNDRSEIQIDENNNYGYGVMFVGTGINQATPAELKKGTTTIKCNKQLNGYFTINFTNFLMLPLSGSPNIPQLLLGNDVEINSGGLFYECKSANGSVNYEGVYGYIKWTYGNNTHEIRAGLDTNNNWTTNSPLQLAYGNDYPNTYRTLSGNVFDSLIGGNVKIIPRSIGLVGIRNYESIGGDLDSPIYYISNSGGIEIYTKFSVKENGKNIRLTLTGYDTNGQIVNVNKTACSSVVGCILSGLTNNSLKYSNGNGVYTNNNVSITNKDFGLFGYQPITYTKINSLASGTITMLIGTDWTQTISFMISGANCSGEIIVTPDGCYSGNKTATISCITGNLNKTETYKRDDNSRTTNNSISLSGNGIHHVIVKDWLGNEKTYEFEVSGINTETLQAPTNLSAEPATGNNKKPTLRWNATNDAGCSNGQDIRYDVQVCKNETCSPNTQIQDGTDMLSNPQRTITNELPNTTGKKYYWRVRASYDANNTSSWSTGTFYLDTTPPAITITNPNSACATTKTGKASVVDSGAGINTIKYIITGSSTCTGTTTNWNNANVYTNNADITLNGTHINKYICFQATDKAGNTGYKRSNQITGIDLSGPTGSIIPQGGYLSGAKRYYSGNDIKLQLIANEVGCSTVTGMIFSCDNTNWSNIISYSGKWASSATPYTFTLSNNYGCSTTDGEKTIYIRYIDNLGNTGDIKTGKIYIDKTAPECNIGSPVSDSNCEINIAIGATDTGVGVFSVDPQILHFSGAGTQYSIVKDYLGNSRQCTGTISQSQFGPDPTVETNINGIPNGWTGNDITVTFNVNVSSSCEGGSNNLPTTTYYCIYDSGSTCTPNIQLVGTSLGIECPSGNECIKYIKFYSTGAGILPETPKISSGIFIDHKGPTCNISYNPTQNSCTSGTVTVTMTGVDTGAGVKEPTSWSTGVTSNQTVSHIFTDLVGNTGKCTTDINWIDKTGGNGLMQLTGYTLSGSNKYYSGLNIKMRLTITNGGTIGTQNCSVVTGMIFSCDNTNWSNIIPYRTEYANMATPYTFTLTDNYGCSTYDGEKTIYMKYVDSIGNIGPVTQSQTLRIDRTKPTCTINYEPNDCSSGTVTGTVSAVDTGIGVKIINPTTLKFTSNGVEKYSTISDYLGNTMQCTGIVHRINNGTATGSIIAVGGVNVQNKGQAFSGNIPLKLSATSAGCSSAVNQMKFSCNGTSRSNAIPYNTGYATTPYPFTLTNDYGCSTSVGTKTIRVEYYVDNTPQRSGSTQIYFDNEAPNPCTINYEPDSNVICTQGTVTATLSTDDSGVGISGENTQTHTFSSNGTRAGTFVDLVGNERNCTAIVDRINPQQQTITGHINVEGGVNVTGKGKSFSGINNLTLHLNASSNGGCDNPVSKMQFSCNGTSWSSLENYSTTKTFNLGSYTNYGCTVDDGNKTIYVKYTFQKTGTITVSTGIYIDRTKPTCNTPTYIPPESDGCTNGTVTATLSANDNGVGMATPTSIQTGFTENGTKTYTFKDQVGNEQDCSAEVHWISSENDTVTTTINGVPTDWTNTSGVNLTFSVDTNSACNNNTDIQTTTYYCTGINTSCNPTKTGTSLRVTCGANKVCKVYVKYYSKINGSSTQEATQTALIKIDRQKPKCDGSGYNITTCTNQNVRGRVYAIDTGSLLRDTSQSPHELALFTGNRSRTFTFYDNVSNYRKCTGTVSRIDKNAPTGTITLTGYTIIDNKYYYSGTTIGLQLSATDSGCSNGNGMKMQFSCNGRSWSPLENYSTTKTFNLGSYTSYGCTVADGNKTIYVRFFDNLGNTGTAVYSGFYIDQTDPQCGITKFTTESCTNRDVTATVSATDAGVGMADPTKQEYTFSENGTRTAVFQDKLGNSVNCPVTVRRIDKYSPNVTFNDTSTPECVGVEWEVTAIDSGCAGLETGKAFMFDRISFGDETRGPGILNINANQTINPNTVPQHVSARDSLGNYTQRKITANLNIKDTLPTVGIRELSYNDDTTPISGKIILYEDLIAAMQAEDGACGPDTMSIAKIKCDNGEFEIIDRKGIMVIPPREDVGIVSCTITFSDDEGNNIEGRLTYYYDTMIPTCTRGNPSAKCIRGGQEGNIDLTCSDKQGQVYVNENILGNIKYNANILTLVNNSPIDGGIYPEYKYVFKYTGKEGIKTGNTQFTLMSNTIFDLAYNTNKQVDSSPVNVDNAGPSFSITTPSKLLECSTGTLTITGVTQVGCASASSRPYSWNGGSYIKTNTYSVYSNKTGSQDIIVKVQDALGNYTQKTGTLIWNDVVLSAKDFTVSETCGEKTVNWKELSSARAGSCEKITATITQNGQKGTCSIKAKFTQIGGSERTGRDGKVGDTKPSIDGDLIFGDGGIPNIGEIGIGDISIIMDYLTYTPNPGMSGEDTCKLELTDGDSTKTITVTWLGIDTIPPVITMESTASGGCRKGGDFIVTGTWNKTVKGFEIKDIIANVGTIGKEFIFEKLNTYAWIVTSPNEGHGETEVSVKKGAVKDMCENENEEGGTINRGYDNEGPKFDVDIKPGNECSKITAEIINVTQIGCAKPHEKPYSWDGGRKYTDQSTLTLTNTHNGTGEETRMVRVQDALGNYTEQEVKFIWENVELSADDTIEKGNVGNQEVSINWLTASHAHAGTCETITATITQTGSIGICEFDPSNPNILIYRPYDNVRGDDSCVLTLTDGESELDVTVNFYDIDTERPTISLITTETGENNDLYIEMYIEDLGTGLKEYRCGDGERQTANNGEHTCNMGTQPEPKTGSINVQAKDKWGNITGIDIEYEWTNVQPTANTISNSADEPNPIILTANATDPGGTTFTYQWYSGNNCSIKLNNETNITYKAAGEPEPTSKYYSYKAIDAQGLESACAKATATRKNVKPTAYDVSGSAPEGTSVVLTANGFDPGGTKFKYQWYSDSNCKKAIPRETKNIYTAPGQGEPNVIKYYYKVQDANGAGSNCATATATRTNIQPYGIISNNGPKQECKPLTYTMSGNDAGGGKLIYQLHEGSSCKGTVLWSGKDIDSGTIIGRDKTFGASGTYTVSLKIIDNQNSGSDCVSSIGLWNDTKPSFEGEKTKNIGNITGTHLKNPFVTPDLIKTLKPIDGACGSSTIEVTNIRCDEEIIEKAVLERNTAILTPRKDIEKDGTCTVTFKDDEGNETGGIITFYVDTIYPTITLSSTAENSCILGGKGQNIQGLRQEKNNEKVLGFEERDVIIDGGTISLFDGGRNPLFTRQVTSPNRNGTYGITTIYVEQDAATDKLGNPNKEPSKKMTWEYDNAAPKVTFNDITVKECESLVWTATATDIGCAKLPEKPYKFSDNSFGNNERSSNNILTLSSGELPARGTYPQTLTVKDSLGNSTQITANLIVIDEEPTFKGSGIVEVGNITGIHITTTFVTPNLVELMQPTDGACGPEPMHLTDINCDNTDTLKTRTVDNDTAILRPNKGFEKSGSCMVIFTDDEGTTLKGTILFYVDTINPTVTLSTDANSCDKGGKGRTVTGKRREKVLGFNVKGITVESGDIKKDSFIEKKNPIFTRIVTSPIKGFGTTTVYINENVATDVLGNPNTPKSKEITWNYDNEGPTITFNNIETAECQSTTWTASATDNGCAGITGTTAYNFSGTSFGNGNWGSNTLNITATQVSTGGITKTQYLTVKDKLGNTSTKSAILTINDTKPSFHKSGSVNIGNITGAHTTQPYVSPNLINLMEPIDGLCGTGNMRLTNVECDNNVSHAEVNENTVTITPKTDLHTNSKCTVTFKDDENNNLTGEIKFYIDTRYPTITLSSTAENSCDKGGKKRTVSGERNENVLGFSINDIKVTNGDIVSNTFVDKNPNFTWQITSPTTSFGTTIVYINENVATDILGNPNKPKSNDLKRNYDNAAPNRPNINYNESQSCLNEFSIAIKADSVNDNGCSNIVSYQFCKSIHNNIEDCNGTNLSERNKNPIYIFKGLQQNTTYYFFVRAKDGLDNTTEWSPAYGTIESLTANDFIGYFNAKKGDKGPFTVTANRKRKSYASAGICDNITVNKIECKGGVGEIKGDILEFTSEATEWTQLHDQTQREQLSCKLTITDGNTTVDVTSIFKIKFDEVYLDPIIITGTSFVDYTGVITIPGGRTYKYTNSGGVTVQINGGFISKEPEKHRYRVSCYNKKDWNEWKQYPSDYNGGVFDWNLIQNKAGCDNREGDRKVYVQLCDAPSTELCRIYAD